MKKSILSLGKTLNKVEQKNINGGNSPKRCNLIDAMYCDVQHVCENGFCKKNSNGVKSNGDEEMFSHLSYTY